MAPPSKQVANFADAVHDIPDGSVVAFGGFAMPGVPYNLIQALHAQGAKSLTCIANTTGGAQQPRMPDIGMLVENGQVKKVISAFTAATRASDVLPFTKYSSPVRSRRSWCHRGRWRNGCAPRAPAFPPSTRRPRSGPSWPRAAKPA